MNPKVRKPSFNPILITDLNIDRKNGVQHKNTIEMKNKDLNICRLNRDIQVGMTTLLLDDIWECSIDNFN